MYPYKSVNLEPDRRTLLKNKQSSDGDERYGRVSAYGDGRRILVRIVLADGAVPASSSSSDMDERTPARIEVW